MCEKYIQFIPKTLQEDFVNNRVIPFIGAGFSKNGVLPNNYKILDWNELGNSVSEYIPNYIYTNAIDAFSLFESEFARTKLIELLAKKLCINHIKPGNAHRALCDTYFDTICTTNFDFLIEQTLNEKNIPFSMIISEDRLPIDINEKTKVIKLHGDFNHPKKMVITEWDYDTYIEENKILATYISNLFITRTLLLIGYSFDDNDIRTLWNIIGSRLGKLSIPAYIVLVDANPIEILRFERRNIKVINLPGHKSNYPEILTTFFKEIKNLIDKEISDKIIYTNENALEEKRLPLEDNRLCFISTPLDKLPFLKTLLYPTLQKHGISPITLDEAIMPGELVTRKIDIIINQSTVAIVDVSGNNANVMWELGNLMSKNKKIILIADDQQFDKLPFNLLDNNYIIYSMLNDNSKFLTSLDSTLGSLFNNENLTCKKENEAIRLLEKKEYSAAVIIAYRILETTITLRFINIGRAIPISTLFIMMHTEDKESNNLINEAKKFTPIRNQLVHSNFTIDKKEATRIVETILSICEKIDEGYISIS